MTNEQMQIAYLVAVVALGVVSLASVVGGIVLSYIGQPVPEFLVALGSASIGALAGILTPQTSTFFAKKE